MVSLKPPMCVVVIKATFGHSAQDILWADSGLRVIKHSSRVHPHLHRIAEIAGGYTLTATGGGWVDDNGDYVEEPGFQVEVMITGTDGDTSLREDEVLCLIREIGIGLDQTAVVVTREEKTGGCLSIKPANGFRLT